jgi:hypothetical protein
VNPVNKLKQAWENFKTGTITQVDKRFDKKTVEQNKVNSALDHQRQMAQGKAKEEERKRKMLEETKGENRDGRDRKEVVGDYLTDRKEKLRQQNLENHISLRQLFRELNNGAEIALTNQARNRTFGQLQDILVDERGIMHIVNTQGQMPMGGPSFGDIVQSPSGMITDMTAGYLPLNLSDEGRYLPSSETVQVPQMVYTEEEGIVFTENHSEKYKNRVAQLQSQVQSLHSENAAKEKAMVGMSQQIKELQRQKETLMTIAESEQAGREKIKEMAENAIENYNQQEIELNKTDAVKEMWEEVTKAVMKTDSQRVDDLMEEIDQNEFDKKEEEMRRTIKMIVNQMPKIQEATQTGSSGGGGEAGGGTGDEF